MNNLRTVKDQMGREVVFPFPPQRIVSLVPSQTEFLLDIEAPVVGRTKFCIHPDEQVNEIPVVGGTKKYRFDQIEKLNPDLIIGNKEENYEEGIERLSKKYPVWMSDIFTLTDSFEMMESIGFLTDRNDQAKKIIEECKSSLEMVRGSKSGKVVYLIWKDPWMAAGTNTFIDHMLQLLGYENLVSQERYPELTLTQIKALNPDKILLSSEPFPFKGKHLETAKDHWPDAECQLVDGELHSWYGSRLKMWK